MKNFLLQAVHNEDHLAPAREIFSVAELECAIISTAFMTAKGLSLLQAVLEPIADRTQLFVGIRNGITTVQSLQKALEIGCETYMVDTGCHTRIFHPKFYYARGAVNAKLLLGSANLTMGGMRTNIEASVLQTLDKHIDADFIEQLEGKLGDMIARYPEHVIRVVDEAQLATLLKSGRLLDERKVRVPVSVGSSIDRNLDPLSRMPLHTHAVNVPTVLTVASEEVNPIELPEPEVTGEDVRLLWASKPLKRAHISIPNRAGTNPKGSMSLTVGIFDGIDQRHYFRNEVFNALDWQDDENLPYKERSAASVKVIIKGINYGQHQLRLSHDTRTDTTSYAQNNYMTSLHWGDIARLVAHEDILGSTLRLYREESDHTHFIIEID